MGVRRLIGAVAAMLLLGSCTQDGNGIDDHQPSRPATTAGTLGAANSRSTQPVDWVLDFNGLGPVQLGMSRAEAQRRAGVPLDWHAGGFEAGSVCSYLSPTPASGLAGVIFLVGGDGVYYASVTRPGITTGSGVGVRSTRAAVLDAYRGRVEVRKRQGHAMLVVRGPRGRAMAFGLDPNTQRVAVMSVGSYDSVVAEQLCD